MGKIDINQMIQYRVNYEVHKTLLDFFSRLDRDTVERLLSIPRSGVKYTEPECEIKADLLYQFYFNELLTIESQLEISKS